MKELAEAPPNKGSNEGSRDTGGSNEFSREMGAAPEDLVDR